MNLPPLSEERRKELVKIAHKYGENTKIALRNVRRDGMDKLKQMEKGNEISDFVDVRYSKDSRTRNHFQGSCANRSPSRVVSWSAIPIVLFIFWEMVRSLLFQGSVSRNSAPQMECVNQVCV